jgi:hypothetical protein
MRSHVGRRGVVLVVLVASGLLVLAPTAGAAPLEDSVVGSGTAGFFGSVQIDARSGPSGESPTGSVSVVGSVRFNGPVTCLAVTDNVATLNISTSQFGLVTMTVTDGTPDIIDALPTQRAPSDCSPFSGGVVGTVSSGDFVVVDSQPIPVPGAKRDCFAGGWRDLANDQGQPFRNQGQCVRYVVAHRHEGAAESGNHTP